MIYCTTTMEQSRRGRDSRAVDASYHSKLATKPWLLLPINGRFVILSSMLFGLVRIRMGLLFKVLPTDSVTLTHRSYKTASPIACQVLVEAANRNKAVGEGCRNWGFERNRIGDMKLYVQNFVIGRASQLYHWKSVILARALACCCLPFQPFCTMQGLVFRTKAKS
jgi:hypothetical protein